MDILKKAVISKLWGERDISVAFHDDVNFLIGKNGSGKTTVINLIAAALTGDYPVLDRLSFQKVELQLAPTERPSDRITVEVEKKLENRLGIPGVTFKIKTKKEDKEFLMDESVRHLPTIGMRQRVRTNLALALQEIASVTWLSIHRAPSRPAREDRSFESSVDKKLDELSNALTKLFSEFASRGETETTKFQQSMFLALLPGLTADQLFASVRKLNLDEERVALIDIFRSFHFEETQFAERVEEHFDLVRSAIERTSWSDEQLAALVAMWSIHRVVVEWGQLRQKLAAIYQSRESFLEIMNQMVQRKRLVISERNELQAEMEGGRRLPLTGLSSGEKQLVIILGEALVQQKRPWIYIADEPELSLHVSWQEKLTANLRQVNPNAQIIFATHSPDIVSTYQDRVIDMEKLFA